MESEISKKDIQVATLDVSREAEFSVSPIHEDSFTPTSTSTVESINIPDAANPPGEKSNLSYHFSKCNIHTCNGCLWIALL